MDFPGHFQFIFKQLNHQRLHAQLCDCVVLVGGQSFQAHRSILAACSSHFRALLSSSDTPDEIEGAGIDRGPSVMELDPEVVTPEAFSTLLDMIYTSTLSLGASNVMDVLLAASHLHLNTVVKACKLHLSRKNFPASAPKGWRSVQQRQQQQGQCPPPQTDSTSSLQQVCSVLEDSDEEDAVVEVSQSGVGEGHGRRGDGPGNAVAKASRFKRKSPEDGLGCKKRSCRPLGANYKQCSPTVTSRGPISPENAGEDLLSPDCLMSADELMRSRGDEEEEEEEEELEQKYEAGKAESDEIQLPSQSDSSTGGVGAWKREGDPDANTVVKVKVGDGGEEEEPEMPVVEVKKENLCTYSPELDPPPPPPPPPPPSPPKDCFGLNGHVNDERATTEEYPVVGGVTSLQSQLCPDPDAGDLGEDSEGLDSLSELAFSCFLNPSAESVMGALEDDDSLASLTAAATAAAAAAAAAAASAAPAGNVEEPTEETNTSSAQCSDSASLVFPVNSAALQQQQLLPNHSSGFSDALVLQPGQNSLTGFLSGIRPGLTLEVSLVPPSPLRLGKGSGATAFRRIAPKVPPGSEAGSDPATDAAADRPPLTRASEDVLSKCKKAAAEDHVLLVEGERKYACNICCKTFMNLTDCKKHIRVHTGEKPYPCLKCGKRFSQSSHLYKHSKNTCDTWREDQSLQEPLL